MVKFDSNDYWQINTWDRNIELDRTPPLIRDELIRQEQLTISQIQELSHGIEKLRILDLACGTGRISEQILKVLSRRVHITLVDFNEHSLAIAKRNLRNYEQVEFVNLDAYKVGSVFPNNFDIVVSLDFLHHISRIDLLLSQICMALRPQGAFIVNAFTDAAFVEWECMKYGKLKSLKRRVLRNATNLLYPSLGDRLKSIVRRYGFARIAGFNRQELLNSFASHFSEVKVQDGFYMWIKATGRILK
jgi:ubiquinone/menaquinone biosynthesis C-methylase UbiE